MKKLIFFSLCISFLLFINCSERTNPTVSETNESEKLSKPKKPKPPRIEASVINLSINGTCLIANDEPYNMNTEEPLKHPVFDFMDHPLNIHYEIQSSTDIQNIRLELIYDANMSSTRDGLWLEFSGVVFNDWEFEANENNFSNTISWDGQIFEYEWFPLFDQLASYNFPVGYDESYGDHYIVQIFAFSDAPSLIISKKAYLWISNAVSRSLELFVENISITTDIAKNKVIPYATITLGNNVNGAYIYGGWEGLINNSILRVGPSVNGIIEITGPSFRKNLSGEILLEIESVVQSSGVYNPFLNSQWVWPDRPVGSSNYY